MRIKVSSAWKDSIPYAKLNNAFVKAKEGLVKVDGVWRQFYLELSVALLSNKSVTVNSYQYNANVQLTLAGTYGGTVTVTRVSGSTGISWSGSGNNWTFTSPGANGTITGTFRFTYANALETSYVDVTLTVYHVNPPPPPPPPPYVPPPYIPPPSGGGGSGVIVDYPTYVKTFERFRWGIRNGTPGTFWWAEVSWNTATAGPGVGRIPVGGGIFTLDGSGAATYYDGDIPITGYHRIIFHFGDGQTVTKYVYVPYYYQDFVKQYGETELLARQLGYYYETKAWIVAGPQGEPRYGLNRAPDKGGLKYWCDSYHRNGNSWVSGLTLAFSDSAVVNNAPDRAATLTGATANRPGSWGGDFYETEPTRF